MNKGGLVAEVSKRTGIEQGGCRPGRGRVHRYVRETVVKVSG